MTTIDAPVGKNVGTFTRPNDIRNFARDQQKIIQLLASIPSAEGGQKEAWANPPLTGADGDCPQLLSDAIFNFQKFWKARGVFHVIDGVVDRNKHTLQQLDRLSELSGPDARQAIADAAFASSRFSLAIALAHLTTLAGDIAADPATPAARDVILQKHRRNIAVVSRRLLLSEDPFNADFRDALSKLIVLVQKNLAFPNTILAAGLTGLCDPSLPVNNNNPLLNHAVTQAARADPKCHLCERFFVFDAADLQRDVVTHEYFHLFGTGDISVNTTADGLNNANTLAQIVALLTDRARQVNSDGNERAVPPLPSP